MKKYNVMVMLKDGYVMRFNTDTDVRAVVPLEINGAHMVYIACKSSKKKFEDWRVTMFKRTESIPFNAFMDGSYKEKKRPSYRKEGTLIASGTALLMTPHMGLAAGVSEATKEKIVHAFDPLVDLIISMSIPIASVILGGATLMIMLGLKEKGYSLMINASIGYCLCQMLPLFIELFSGIGTAISS